LEDKLVDNDTIHENMNPSSDKPQKYKNTVMTPTETIGLLGPGLG